MNVRNDPKTMEIFTRDFQATWPNVTSPVIGLGLSADVRLYFLYCSSTTFLFWNRRFNRFMWNIDNNNNNNNNVGAYFCCAIDVCIHQWLFQFSETW